MGLIYANIELINGEDLALARNHYLDANEIKRLQVTMLVDTGSVYLCINETIQEMLQLPVVDKRRGQLADGRIVEYDVVAPLEVRFKNRRCTTSAMVLPGNNEPLLGAIPMEDMDVVIIPERQELDVHPDHPDYALLSLK
ncbi:MAG: clan AA aspartic protease [Chitinophagaceae bacterium]|nr:clan AA aspartic protease [Chitinophagaceae bacterium]